MKRTGRKIKNKKIPFRKSMIFRDLSLMQKFRIECFWRSKIAEAGWIPQPKQPKRIAYLDMQRQFSKEWNNNRIWRVFSKRMQAWLRWKTSRKWREVWKISRWEKESGILGEEKGEREREREKERREIWSSLGTKPRENEWGPGICQKKILKNREEKRQKRIKVMEKWEWTKIQKKTREHLEVKERKRKIAMHKLNHFCLCMFWAELQLFCAQGVIISISFPLSLHLYL